MPVTETVVLPPMPLRTAEVRENWRVMLPIRQWGKTVSFSENTVGGETHMFSPVYEGWLNGWCSFGHFRIGKWFSFCLRLVDLLVYRIIQIQTEMLSSLFFSRCTIMHQCSLVENSLHSESNWRLHQLQNAATYAKIWTELTKRSERVGPSVII